MRKYSKMDKGAKDKLAGSPGENGGGQNAQKDLHSRTGRDETKRKTQERMERRSRKRSSSPGSEKVERVGDRQGKMERYCSTGQSPQRAVAPMEEEDRILGQHLQISYGRLFMITFLTFSSFRSFVRNSNDTTHFPNPKPQHHHSGSFFSVLSSGFISCAHYLPAYSIYHAVACRKLSRQTSYTHFYITN